MKRYYVKLTDRSNAETERMGFQLEGLEFRVKYDLGDVWRGYVVVPFMAWSREVGPVFLTADDLQEVAV